MRSVVSDRSLRVRGRSDARSGMRDRCGKSPTLRFNLALPACARAGIMSRVCGRVDRRKPRLTP